MDISARHVSLRRLPDDHRSNRYEVRLDDVTIGSVHKAPAAYNHVAPGTRRVARRVVSDRWFATTAPGTAKSIRGWRDRRREAVRDVLQSAGLTWQEAQELAATIR